MRVANAALFILVGEGTGRAHFGQTVSHRCAALRIAPRAKCEPAVHQVAQGARLSNRLSVFPITRGRPLTDDTITEFGESARPWVVPEIDRARQATASLRGYVYQLHQSAKAWLALQEGELLVLEVAEDYALVLNEPDRLDDILSATQVKNRESGTVNLNSEDVLETVRALCRFQRENPGRPIRFTFLTTSPIGTEHKNPLPSKTPGLKAWYKAATGGNVEEIRNALLQRLEDGELKAFVASASDAAFRQDLLAPITFACGAPPWDLIAAANRDALVAIRGSFNATAAMAAAAYDAVVGKIIETALSSTRTLDRAALLALLERATAVAIPSQLAVDLLREKQSRPAVDHIDVVDLRNLASVLLGAPPSLVKLFPDATPTALAAFDTMQAIDRAVMATQSKPSDVTTARISDLLELPQAKHLVLGPAGSGKTYTLWRAAKDVLTGGALIPIFLQGAQVKTWDELTAIISNVAPNITIAALLNDERVCIFFDGWSEFALGEFAPEKSKALRALHKARVIANAKFTDIDDAIFKTWSLELLSRSQVIQVLAQSSPGVPQLPDKLLEFLRLPLLLSIHVLAEANANQTGELLRQFHQHLARKLPVGITEALAGAC